MSDIKKNWNKYRNSRADIEILQIAWSASQNCILTLLGGRGDAANWTSIAGQQGNKKIGKMIICILC